MYMLDTNICIYILKKHPPEMKTKFNQIDSVHISAIVYSELCYGVELSPYHLQTPRQKQLNEFISLLKIHTWDEKSANIYAKIRAYLKKKGIPIGNMDMLIAAHALSLNAVLVTNNTHEFSKVPELKFENWI
ncbi:MAG TPA: type II toxin-antitoxin system VapC family toxin [Thioploca sp.]|nr:type II toxin-antitoxin system VapC family toxin [Thioploca sp.]